MRLCLVRHGPAVPSGTKGVPDAERRLTPEGRKRTLRAFEGLRCLGLGIDEIHTSPLPRARETAEILARVLKLGAPKVLERLLPGRPARGLLEFVAGLKGKVPALVGHEPALSTALAELVGGGAYGFKKAGVAVVDLRAVSPLPRGTLRLLLTPSALRRLAR